MRLLYKICVFSEKGFSEVGFELGFIFQLVYQIREYLKHV